MKYCNGSHVTPEPWWEFCPKCGKPMDPNLMKLIQKVIEREAKPFEFDALCHKCGEMLYPKYNPEKMTGITVHAGICPRCNREETLIPLNDWLHASGKGGTWD